MFTKILVAVDGSTEATHALETAIEISSKFGGSLHLIHVVREMQLPKNLGLMDTYADVNRQRHDLLNSVGEQILSQAKRVAQSKGIDSVQTDTGSGDPANAIAKHAGNIGADLVVMGSRGLGQVEGMLMGSVSRKVSNIVKVDCLIVH